MDFARGSRRARHVAANANATTATTSNATATASANAAATGADHDALSPIATAAATAAGRLGGASALVTPDAPPPLHRTPDQPVEQIRRAPPPNPFRLYRTAQPTNHPRLSMPLVDSDDSGSEPDLSVLGMARPGPTAAATEAIEQRIQSMSYHDGEDEENQDEDVDGGVDDDEALSQEQYEAEDTSIEEEQGDEEEDEGVPLIDPATAGLKEISNLARFTVSSHKPGNGVEELRSDDLKMFWQSDGPQPHKLTVYFVKRVGIRDIRFFVDYNEDESYTPTKIIFKSGTSENNLIEFATIALESPVGWQQVPLAGAGGDPDGNTLVSYVLQMEILENHQNGKDTHLRGIKIYAFDADSAQGPGRDVNPVEDVVGLVDEAVARNVHGGAGHRLSSVKRNPGLLRFDPAEGGLTIPDFMREPELR
ncbi:putative anaphase promoting complex subunit 10 [Dactylonectria macrodidyma]|uniref:Anaphase promoting complex subunit 10 n=1 Tax=Dactylonectria macrodidyma TaxID=307937 RepID=A0A9P9EXF7_9HYPO|nr:putative anaphase promoting complex subunit 10 [Dactylonectria macrodidyma]